MKPIDRDAIARDLSVTAETLRLRHGGIPAVVRLKALAGLVGSLGSIHWRIAHRLAREIDAIGFALKGFPDPRDKKLGRRVQDVRDFIDGFVARERDDLPPGVIRPGSLKAKAFAGTGRIRPSDKPVRSA